MLAEIRAKKPFNGQRARLTVDGALPIEIAQTNLGLVEHRCLRTLTKFQQNCYMGSIITF